MAKEDFGRHLGVHLGRLCGQTDRPGRRGEAAPGIQVRRRRAGHFRAAPLAGRRQGPEQGPRGQEAAGRSRAGRLRHRRRLRQDRRPCWPACRTTSTTCCAMSRSAQILGTKKMRTDTIVPPTEIPGGMDYETCFWRTAHAFREASKVDRQRTASTSSGSSSRASSSTSRAKSSACATPSATRTSASCSTPATRTCARWSARGRWARRKRCPAAWCSSPTC